MVKATELACESSGLEGSTWGTILPVKSQLTPRIIALMENIRLHVNNQTNNSFRHKSTK